MLNNKLVQFVIYSFCVAVLLIGAPMSAIVVWGYVDRDAAENQGSRDILKAIDRMRSVKNTMDAEALLVACRESAPAGITCGLGNHNILYMGHRAPFDLVEVHFDRPAQKLLFLPMAVNKIHLVGTAYIERSPQIQVVSIKN